MVQATEEEAPLDAEASELKAPEAAKANRLPEIPVPAVAVITCIEDLQRVLADHQKWADAVLDPNTEVAVGRANLKGADLRGYDLAGVNLSGANLSQANLAGVDLEGANLTVANLQGAVLACANLRHAKLRRARIDGADLRGADLTNANLTGVDLSKATLKTADSDDPEEAAASGGKGKRAGALTEPSPADLAATAAPDLAAPVTAAELPPPEQAASPAVEPQL